VTREQRLVFGEVAETYDRARPSYPGEIAADIVMLLHLPSPARVLEIGTGTGKATALFARAGHELLGLEPSDAMAAIGRRNLAAFSNVRIEVTTLEDWPLEAGAFDVVTAGQAWHWVPPAVGLPKAHAALRPGGGIAVFWNWEIGASPQVRGALDAAYDACAPSLVKQPLKQRVGDVIAEQLEETPLFGTVTRRRYPWERTYTSAQYVDLLATHSDHRMLSEPDRRRLHDAITGTIDAHGGTMTVEYATELFAAARVSAGRTRP
jgi:SAM-dependent methyltransferase